MKKIFKKVVLKYRGMVNVDICVTEISNGYIVNNKFYATREEVAEDIEQLILNPNILFESKK